MVRCICKPYHHMGCPMYGEDNRLVEHDLDCTCLDCVVTQLREARAELLAESKEPT